MIFFLKRYRSNPPLNSFPFSDKYKLGRRILLRDVSWWFSSGRGLQEILFRQFLKHPTILVYHIQLVRLFLYWKPNKRYIFEKNSILKFCNKEEDIEKQFSVCSALISTTISKWSIHSSLQYTDIIQILESTRYYSSYYYSYYYSFTKKKEKKNKGSNYTLISKTYN